MCFCFVSQLLLTLALSSVQTAGKKSKSLIPLLSWLSYSSRNFQLYSVNWCCCPRGERYIRLRGNWYLCRMENQRNVSWDIWSQQRLFYWPYHKEWIKLVFETDHHSFWVQQWLENYLPGLLPKHPTRQTLHYCRYNACSTVKMKCGGHTKTVA